MFGCLVDGYLGPVVCPFVGLQPYERRKRLQSDIAQKLCTNGYWDRVWIIREIGKARKIQICFGDNHEMQVDWDVFIYKLKALFQRKLLHDGLEGPLRLDTERQERYNWGHTLRNLLENHQNAICKDPRDKIYVFIGLASDARGYQHTTELQKTLRNGPQKQRNALASFDYPADLIEDAISF